MSRLRRVQGGILERQLDDLLLSTRVNPQLLRRHGVLSVEHTVGVGRHDGTQDGSHGGDGHVVVLQHAEHAVRNGQTSCGELLLAMLELSRLQDALQLTSSTGSATSTIAARLGTCLLYTSPSPRD